MGGRFKRFEAVCLLGIMSFNGELAHSLTCRRLQPKGIGDVYTGTEALWVEEIRGSTKKAGTGSRNSKAVGSLISVLVGY